MNKFNNTSNKKYGLSRSWEFYLNSIGIKFEDTEIQTEIYGHCALKSYTLSNQGMDCVISHEHLSAFEISQCNYYVHETGRQILMLTGPPACCNYASIVQNPKNKNETMVTRLNLVLSDGSFVQPACAISEEEFIIDFGNVGRNIADLCRIAHLILEEPTNDELIKVSYEATIGRIYRL